MRIHLYINSYYYSRVIIIIIIYSSLEIARLKRQSVEIIRLMAITLNGQWPQLHNGVITYSTTQMYQKC